jgi:hypothetical protein
MPGRILIEDAKRIAVERRYPLVVIFGISESGHQFEVTTYGMTRKLCKLAASFGEQFAQAIFDGRVSLPEQEPPGE